MSTQPIPAWDADGRLPPTSGGASQDRAPYKVSLLDLVLRFGTTPERRVILRGFFAYRTALKAAGLVNGFQWVNGSFSEQVELIQNRPPNDVDVVTFFHLPSGINESTLLNIHPALFDHGQIKSKYHVDAYLVGLFWSPEDLVEQTSYWYSMWAHRRGDDLWKGFVQVDLSTTDDQLAMDQLGQLDMNPTTP